PYKCGECGKSFKQSSAFLKHQRIHGEEKAFRGPGCGKSFLEGLELRSHQGGGEDPYKCWECGKSFKQSSAFLKHQR
ncbi:ZN629 protein, partial [Centropus unirufus]|nr:ZN629 protein [Centropus unirufus]